jgi:hypothetical protein
MFVKHDMVSQGLYGYCLKRLYTSNWCWAYMKHHFLHHNQLVVEEFNSERKKGSIRYHFTLEASRLKEDFEGLRLRTYQQFDMFRALVAKFAGVGAQTPPPSLKEATKNVELDRNFKYIVRSKNNKNPAGKATYPIPKQCCFFDFKFNLTINEIEIRTKYERLKLTLVLVKEPWAIALLTVNSRLLRNEDKQSTLLIIPIIFIQNHKGGNYKVVSVQGDWIFADCTLHTDNSLVKTQLQFTTDEAQAIIHSKLASNEIPHIL